VRLENKSCLITGSASGIGKATAQLFAREGARLVLADIDAEDLARTGEELKSGGASVETVITDVADSSQVQAMLALTLKAYGRLDVLVNNAGYGIAATAEATDEEAWDRLMAVNVKGVFLGSKYAVPIMREQGGGVIVNTASVTSVMAIANRAAYVASKGAVAGLTRAMALDHAKDGIRVNCVAPGTIETPYFKEIFAQSPDPTALRKELEARHVMNRLGTPEEIANAILFLACDESSFATGSTVFIDGGMSIF